jgi:uncharacterized protein YndB with AHSA1/START domain
VLRWTLYILLALGGLVGLVAVIGLTLPKGHRASKTTTYQAPPDVVFAALSDVARYGDWRSDVKRIEMLPDDNGRRMFREHGSNGVITFRVEESTAPSRLLVRIADPSLPFGGTWTHELRATPSGGTELTTTEDGEVYNPIFRFMSKFFFSPTATINAYQTALGKKLGRKN